jgi:hypothetical protein
LIDGCLRVAHGALLLRLHLRLCPIAWLLDGCGSVVLRLLDIAITGLLRSSLRLRVGARARAITWIRLAIKIAAKPVPYPFAKSVSRRLSVCGGSNSKHTYKKCHSEQSAA